MSDKLENPPAYPGYTTVVVRNMDGTQEVQSVRTPGMTLHDRVAMQAYAAMIGADADNWDADFDVLAYHAHDAADAFLTERSRRAKEETDE